MGYETREEVLDESAEGEEFRMVMRLIALHLKRAIEADSDEERLRILSELKCELEGAASSK